MVAVYRGRGGNPRSSTARERSSTNLEGRCCGFIWRKIVHGAKTSDLKYCYSCLEYDGVKRWLYKGCRDDRKRQDSLAAHCMPGHCPALLRRDDMGLARCGSQTPAVVPSVGMLARGFQAVDLLEATTAAEPVVLWFPFRPPHGRARGCATGIAFRRRRVARAADHLAR